MAIGFVGSSISGKAGATSGDTTLSLSSGLTGGSRSSVQAGDLVVAIFSTAGGAISDRTLSISDGTTGYTLVGSELFVAGSTYSTNLRVALKVMGGSPDASTTFGPTGGTTEGGVTAVYVFSGVDTTTPLDVAAATATGTASTRANPPSITPSTAGAEIVAVGAGALDSIPSIYTSSDLSSFISAIGADNQDSVLGVGRHDWTSGAFDAAVFGGSQTDAASSWAALTLALRPIVSVGLTPGNAAHSHAATSPSIAPKSALVPANAAHGSSSTSPGITPHSAVAPANASHAHEASEPAVTSATLTIANAAHAHAAGQPAIAWHGAIISADAAHGHQTSSPSVSMHYTLTISAAQHAHVATSPILRRTAAVPASRRFTVPASRAAQRRFAVPLSRAGQRRFTIEE